jgi:hypothetical protein
MRAIRDTLKGLVQGTIVTRNRDDLRSGLQMATSGRHCLFFEDQSRILVVRVLHNRMDYRRHLENSEPFCHCPPSVPLQPRPPWSPRGEEIKKRELVGFGVLRGDCSA